MVKDVRVTYNRSHCYNTKSNKRDIIKTPGGKLVLHNKRKHRSGHKCGDCGTILPGVKHHKPGSGRRCDNRVIRAYGGSRCHSCVKGRIMRAFFIHEQRIVKRVVAEAAKAAKAAGKK